MDTQRRVRDLLGALPLIGWYLWGLWQQIPIFIERLPALSAGSHIGAPLTLQIVAQAASIAFTSLLIVLLVVRDMPRAQARGLGAYAAAALGTFAVTSFFFLSPAALTTSLFTVATLCIIVGFGLSIYALIYLGGSFAVLPSARTLITGGPYRYVRHPLYLFEELAVVGIALQFAQPWSLLVMLVHLAAQLARMRYEEQALIEAFPEYADYAARTARFIPGIY